MPIHISWKWQVSGTPPWMKFDTGRMASISQQRTGQGKLKRAYDEVITGSRLAFNIAVHICAARPRWTTLLHQFSYSTTTPTILIPIVCTDYCQSCQFQMCNELAIMKAFFCFVYCRPMRSLPGHFQDNTVGSVWHLYIVGQVMERTWRRERERNKWVLRVSWMSLVHWLHLILWIHGYLHPIQHFSIHMNILSSILSEWIWSQ